MPRDTAGTFEPQIVKKRQRRLTGVDEMVLSLSAKGLTHGEISAHLAEVYGAEVSKQTISPIADKVMDHMAEWQNRPLDRVYPVLIVDAINVKIRDGQVANRPIYVVMAERGRHPRHPRHLGRRRRRGREVLAARVHRAEEPRPGRCAHAGLRWAQGPSRGRGEPVRQGKTARVRQWIEAVIDTLKGQLSLEQHGARTPAGVYARTGQRLLALAAGIWHNWTTRTPVKRSLIAYDQ